MRKKILITRRIPQPGIDLLKRFKTDLNTNDRDLSRRELLARVKGVDGLLSMLTNAIDAELMDAAGPNLKVVANYAVGFNNIDVAEATQRGIAVGNTPGVLTETTADLAWALIMSAARRITEGDRFVRAGKFKGTHAMLMLGGDVHGKTLGVVGFGRIGQVVARRALGFNMKVIYHDERRATSDERRLHVRYVPLARLLKESDFISLNVPLTDKTKHLIQAKELRMMKKTAFLINTARGPVVEEQALVTALRKGTIAGAGLDVYENEPKLAAGLVKLDNVVLLPHIGSASLETRTKMALMAAGSIVAVLSGKRPENVVNPEVLNAS